MAKKRKRAQPAAPDAKLTKRLRPINEEQKRQLEKQFVQLAETLDSAAAQRVAEAKSYQAIAAPIREHAAVLARSRVE
jgi:hypothetical protein